VPETAVVLERPDVEIEISANAKLTGYGPSNGERPLPTVGVQTDWLRPSPRRSVEQLALESFFGLEAVKRKHPAWFRNDIEYPVEDFSTPDFSDAGIELPE
jgi:hypothetical protein